MIAKIVPSFVTRSAQSLATFMTAVLLLGISLGACAQDLKTIQKNFSPMLSNKNIWAGITEVTTGEYRTFLTALKASGSPAYHTYLPDSTGWPANSNISAFYFSHPAYKNYPVVGVSFEGAAAYCQWLTDQYNQSLQAKGSKVLVRLPSEKEWQEAALAQIIESIDPMNLELLPWSDYPYFNFPDKKGKFRANTAFIMCCDSLPRQYITDGFLATAPVKSFAPNDFGLYDVIGNVAEMTLENGIAKGGSWMHDISECYIPKRTPYDKPATTIGFRVFLEILK